MKNLQKIIDQLENNTLNKIRVIGILFLTLIFGIFLHNKISPKTAAPKLALQTGMLLELEHQSRSVFENEMAGGDISIETQNALLEENKSQNNIKENIEQNISEENIIEISKDDEAIKDLSAEAIIALEITNSEKNAVLQKNISRQLPMASLTKVMTAVIVTENLKNDEVITIGKSAVQTEGNAGDLIVGEKLSSLDLLKIMLIVSSNDAAVAFQEHFTLKQMNLIKMMNEKAVLLEMENTYFTNPNGLDDIAHYSTAEDFAKLGAYITKNELIMEIISKKSEAVNSLDHKISHYLLSNNQLLHENFEEVIGGKTGYTKNAGGCMLSILEIEGKKFITVVLGSDDRFRETEKIIEIIKNHD